VNRKLEALAERRKNIAPAILPLYQQGLGHKAIAKKTGFSPRIVRTILIEQGVYKPGSLFQSELHKRQVHEGNEAYLLRTKTQREKWGDFLQWMRTMQRLRVFAKPRAFLPKLSPEERRKKDQAKEMERYHGDPQFNAKHKLRKRIDKIIRQGSFSTRTQALLGCTKAEFLKHIESQFEAGMTWDNRGVGEGKWNFDHVIPCCYFDLTDPNQEAECSHHTNVRPLWSKDNMRLWRSQLASVSQ